MNTIHAAVGFAIVGGWFVFFVWGLIGWLAKRDPGAWYWRFLAFLQLLLALQLAAGVVLLAAGRTQSLLHYAYGLLFPVIAVVVAHVLARGMEQGRDALLVFVIGSFVVFGLTLRALATGLGLG
ncbi:MAG: hypothetical protein ACRDGU_08490 [Actinomycetota bacterium]